MELTSTEPGWFFVAASIGGKHEKVGLGGIIQVQHSRPFGGDGAEIPAGGVDAHDFARGLKGPWLRRVAFTVRPPAETQKPAVGRPVHVVDLVGLILYTQAPVADGGCLGVEVNGCGGDFMVTSSPGKLFSIRAETRTAARDFQIQDVGPSGFDQQYCVLKAHARMHRRNDPFAVLGP